MHTWVLPLSQYCLYTKARNVHFGMVLLKYHNIYKSYQEDCLDISCVFFNWVLARVLILFIFMSIHVYRNDKCWYVIKGRWHSILFFPTLTCKYTSGLSNKFLGSYCVTENEETFLCWVTPILIVKILQNVKMLFKCNKPSAMQLIE